MQPNIIRRLNSIGRKIRSDHRMRLFSDDAKIIQEQALRKIEFCNAKSFVKLRRFFIKFDVEKLIEKKPARSHLPTS